MNPDRHVRPPFDIGQLQGLSDEAANRLVFDWWCDEQDRQLFIRALGGQPREVPSRAPLQDDPAPWFDAQARQGVRAPPLVMLTDPADIDVALTRPADFSNAPYAQLAGGAFLLAQDPAPAGSSVDWHGEQRAFIGALLAPHAGSPGGGSPGLQALAEVAVAQAGLTALARDEFDLACYAEQAMLRYMGLLYGFATHDHGLLEDASRSVYRALQYVAVGQHFVSEAALLPAARQAVGRLAARCAELSQQYVELARSPRRYGPPDLKDMPEGTQPLARLGLGTLGQPLLARLHQPGGRLSGRDRAMVAATLLAGTVGNVVSAACLVVDSLVDLPQMSPAAGQACPPPPPWLSLQQVQALTLPALTCLLPGLLAARPPLTVVPRRTREAVRLPSGKRLLKNTDCLLLLEALSGSTGPHAWGNNLAMTAVHPCLGQALTTPLLAQLVHRVLRLPRLRRATDGLTGVPLPLERLWGFGCSRLPLHHNRQQDLSPRNPRRRRTNLIVAMRVKAPQAVHAPALRRLIAGAIPRVDQVLADFGHVVHAWFEMSDDEGQLVLRTLYEGDFDSYIRHFALQAGDLFDRLFEHLEDAPPRPVAEYPQEFVETIRRFNRAPLGAYLYGS